MPIDQCDLRVPDAVQMRLLIYGHLLSRAICAVAARGIPDLLAAGPATAGQLAAAVECRPDALGRVLNALAAFGVLEDRGAAGFGLTGLGWTLTSSHPASALPTALMAAAEMGDCWHALGSVMDTAGTTAFASVFGTDFFSYLAGQPAFRANFYQSQEAGLQLELAGLLDVIKPASGPSVIVDVGGGDGALLAALCQRHEQARGLLVDQAHSLAQAQARFAADGLGARCEAVACDFFAEVPAGADLYLLRHILHDWPDEDCLRILRNCGRAMPPGSRLVVIEALMAGDLAGEDAAAHQMAVLMDIYMLAVLDGSERDRAQFSSLLKQAGFGIRAIYPVSFSTCAIEAEVIGE